MKPICVLFLKIAAVSTVLSLFSCTRDNVPAGGGEEGTDRTTISFLVESPHSLPTRGGGTISDNIIETLDILAFSADGPVEKYLYSVGSVSVDDTGTDNIKKITASVLKMDTPQRFVLVANAADQVASLGSPAAGTDKETLVYPLIYSKKTEWSNDPDDFVPIPMWGESAVVTVGDNDLSMKVKMLRMAARVEVYMAEDSDILSLSGLYVYNANSRGYIVPSASNLIYDNGENTYKADAPTLPPDESSNPLKLASPLGFTTETDTGKLPYVYLFEAAAAASVDDATCIVLEGTYRGDNSPTYYRLDFATVDDNGQFDEFKPILRNHRYIFNITDVEDRGHGSADEALKAGGSNLGVQLYVWDLGDMTDFVFNNNYVLGVSQKEFTLGSPEATGQLLVTTDYKGGWKASVDDRYDWLSIVSSTSTDPNAKDPLVFRVQENKTGKDRTGYIVVTAGVLSQTITVTQAVEDYDELITGANTYMVTPGGTVSIPINWANKDGVKRILPTDNLETVFIWTDNPVGMSSAGAVRSMAVTGKGNERELEVTAGSAIGSAVVGVKSGGILRWSWLIWVTDYEPDNGGLTYTLNGFTMMDRFLGAPTAEVDLIGSSGLYFQWGRKDPFPYSDELYLVNGAPPLKDSRAYDRTGTLFSIATEEASLYRNIEPGIRNPTVFYKGNRTNDESYLWKEPDGSKGVQDPCPDGWRLPPNTSSRSPWLGVSRILNSDSDNYVTVSGLGEWQLAGQIIAETCTYAQLGVYSMAWSNDVSNNSKYGILFAAGKNTGVSQTQVGALTSAAPVRCVKEYD